MSEKNTRLNPGFQRQEPFKTMVNQINKQTFYPNPVGFLLGCFFTVSYLPLWFL